MHADIAGQRGLATTRRRSPPGKPPAVAEPVDYRECYALLIGRRIDLCPCGDRMVEVGFRAGTPRNSPPDYHMRCDTS